MKTKLLLLSLIFLINHSFSHNFTEEEMKKFKIEVFNHGNNTNYPSKGNKVKAHYKGSFLNGEKFDSSYDRNSPLEFQVGIGQVIKCWDLIIMKMSKGDHVKVECPSDLAYGARGAGGIIPPNADLQFEIELIDFNN